MIILSNGYKQPETGDFGDIWFPSLEDNIQRLNDHTHDGNDSEKLTATSTVGIIASILSGEFTVQGNGEFRALVSVPVGGEFDTMNIQFRDASTGEQVHLRHEKFSATQYYVYTNFVEDFGVLYTT